VAAQRPAQVAILPNPPSTEPDPRFHVPPLPPDSPLPRWQQFCWVGGGEALAHLNEAGAQGWELVNVSVAATSDVAVPHSDTRWGDRRVITSDYIAGRQTWIACFKRPVPAASSSGAEAKR